MSKTHFLHNIKNFFVLVLTATIILMCSRFWFLLKITDLPSILQHKQDFLLSMITGFRFDIKVAVIAYSPIFLFGSLCALANSIYLKFLKFKTYYVALITFLLISISIGNYYFYTTYGTYYDVFMFAFLNEEKQAVMTSMWQDYPIISSVFASVFFTYIITKVATHFSKSQLKSPTSNATPSNNTVIVTSVLSLIAIIILARGSIGAFPLGRYDANVSTFSPLNIVTPNAFMAIDWARKDYQNQTVLKPVAENDLKQAMERVIGQSTPIYKTPKNAYLESNHPNVVLALMESMGTNFLVDDDARANDLLGNLRPHFSQDFLFTRFQAGTSGTWDSIMMMLTQSNTSNISQSAYKKVKLESLATLPYSRAGYEVSFVYAGASTWRNSKQYLLHQGFDHFYDHDDVLKQFPEAKLTDGEWGLADEYAFKFTQHLLDNSEKPQMIFIMSLTNHPPFKLPSSYETKPTSLSSRLKALAMNEHSETLLSEQTYQYASNSLGNFISNIKQDSKLGSNTIIAASGDHHMRNMNMDMKSEYAISYAVPFYLHVPEDILKNVPHIYDGKRIGSHRDIFPTLYHFSLSNQNYISLGGQNLLGQKVDNIGFNQNRVITENGAYDRDRPQDLYQWQEDALHTKDEPVKNPMPNFSREYSQLQSMYIRYLINKS
ncbi:sulfatase-like hydrolase/transferase [Vibrio algivorus]|uniref:Sulfatase-like hydrolase/transferase n=2 Tax=Vibrio algivorus TaxID=1667024 RepID=A0A557P5P5_9VIBR|nr:sulfatase-like hydrolase/transferase [Vibrio algivorus]